MAAGGLFSLTPTPSHSFISFQSMCATIIKFKMHKTLHWWKGGGLKCKNKNFKKPQVIYLLPLSKKEENEQLVFVFLYVPDMLLLRRSSQRGNSSSLELNSGGICVTNGRSSRARQRSTTIELMESNRMGNGTTSCMWLFFLSLIQRIIV